MAKRKRCRKCGLIDASIRAAHREARKRNPDFKKLQLIGKLLLDFDTFNCDPGCPTIPLPRNR